MQWLNDFWTDQQGQDLIEYSLLITFVAIACMAMMATPKPVVKGIWTQANQRLNQALPGS